MTRKQLGSVNGVRPSLGRAPVTNRREVEFVGSGSYMLDKVLGGGWATGRVANVVGDKAAGKTLIAVEACANFATVVNSLDDIRYVEAERAYSVQYGESIGMPEGVVPIDNISTVEGLFADLKLFCERRKGRQTPSLYVVDSLDALSDEAEMTREIDKGSYGTSKARKLSELFRREITTISNANCTLLIVSQIRDKIGITFGETKQRSGGHALDFYASQIIWLSEIKKLSRTVDKVPRMIGTHVRCLNKKNKVAKPFRVADMTVLFNYGVDDELSMLDWLEANQTSDREVKELRSQLAQARGHKDREWLGELNGLLREMVEDRWSAIEAKVAPQMAKYPR